MQKSSDSDRSPAGVHPFAPLLLAAAAIRIAINNVSAFSRADETVYLLYAKALAAGEGYPRIIRMFVDDRGMWVLPNPLRWSYLGAASLACSLTGDDTHVTLALLSTIAGILSVALTYWIARDLFGNTIALTATALVATSPLQLALGRRALADEFFCAAVLLSIACLLQFLRSGERWWLVAWIAGTTVAIAAKEQFLFFYPVVLFFWWLRTRKLGWRELLAWAMPPLLFAVIFSLLARDAMSFFRIAQIITSEMTAPYAEQFQSGPWFRLVIDSLAVSPIVTMLGIAAGIVVAIHPGNVEREVRHLALLAFGIVAVHALLPSQNLRYIVSADSLLRIVVAAFLVWQLRARPRVIVAIVLLNAMVELLLFHRIFMIGEVYDPVTANLLRALQMIP